jgi:hypothetical protein
MMCSIARFTVLNLYILTEYVPICKCPPTIYKESASNCSTVDILYALEMNVSLIVVSIPLLKPLIRSRKNKFQSSIIQEHTEASFHPQASQY